MNADLEDWKEIIILDQPVSDSAFDPASRFDEWLAALESFRNHTQAALRPSVYLESDEQDFAEALRLNDQFPDQIRSEGTLVVTEHGRLLADIEVNAAIIDGLFKGKITAKEEVRLENHALVIGEINTPALTIRGGAIIEGRCYFEPAEQPDQWEQSGWQAFKVGFARVWNGRISQ